MALGVLQGKLTEAVAQHRLHLGAAAALVAAIFALLSLGPSLSAVAGFFWPLLLSTGFLLLAVAVIVRLSPPPADDASGEDLIDFVAGRPTTPHYSEPPDRPEDDDEAEAEAAAAAEPAEHHTKSQ